MSSEEVSAREPPPRPSAFLFLNLPFGITTGFIVVVVPYLVTRAGLSVVTAASVVAIGLVPKAWKFLWAPVADLKLTLKTWYWIGAAVAAGALLGVGLLPLRGDTVWLLAACAFLAEFGSSFVTLALGGLMAQAMPESVKGRTAGAYQLGGKVGRGVGGGVGIWLASHAPTPFASCAALGATCLLCALGLRFVPEPAGLVRTHRTGERVLEIARELWALARSPRGALVIALVVAPIGISGAANFWSAIAGEWRVSPTGVALVSGLASVGVAAIGCLIAGWWADRIDRRTLYLTAGVLVAAESVAFALAPRTPGLFAAGTLTQSSLIAMTDVAASAMVLDVIGTSAAATKYSVLLGLGNLPELVMTPLSGWVHDRWGTTTMLLAEAGIATGCIAMGVLALRRVRRVTAALQPSPV